MTTIELPQSIGKVAHRSLSANGLTTLNQLVTKTEQELLAIHGVGPKAIRLLKEAFKEHDLKATML